MFQSRWKQHFFQVKGQKDTNNILVRWNECISWDDILQVKQTVRSSDQMTREILHLHSRCQLMLNWFTVTDYHIYKNSYSMRDKLWKTTQFGTKATRSALNRHRLTEMKHYQRTMLQCISEAVYCYFTYGLWEIVCLPSKLGDDRRKTIVCGRFLVYLSDPHCFIAFLEDIYWYCTWGLCEIVYLPNKIGDEGEKTIVCGRILIFLIRSWVKF